MFENTNKKIGEMGSGWKFWEEQKGDSEKNRFGEPVKSPQIRTLRIQLGFVGCLILFGIITTIWYTSNGIYIALGLIGVVVGSICGLWWGIRIKCNLYTSVEIKKNRAVDEIAFYSIPEHYDPLWDKKGIPIELKNKFDHSSCFLVNKVNTDLRTIECGYSTFDRDINYLLDKNCYVDMKSDWLMTKERCRIIELSADLTAEVRFAMLLEKLEQYIFVDPSMLLLNRDFGQDRFIIDNGDGTGVKSVSLYGTSQELEDLVMRHRADLERLEQEKEKEQQKDSNGDSNGK